MHDDGQRIDRLARNQDIELDHGRFPHTRQLIIERCIATGDRFQAVVKVQHDFVERQLVGQHDSRRGHIFEVLLPPAFLLHQLEDATDIFFAGQDGGDDHRLFDLVDVGWIGPAGWVLHFDDRCLR